MPEKLEFPATVIVDVWQSPSGLWFATSRMMKGVTIVGNSREEAIAKVPGALADIATLCRDIYFEPPTRVDAHA